MKTVILDVLCEGWTEEAFVKKVLNPYLAIYQIVTKVSVLTTNRKKNIRGGMLSFSQVENDLKQWCRQVAPYSKGEIHCFTTMFDFYALPNDFPAYESAMRMTDHYASVRKLEQEMANRLTFCPRFIPYIQLHEFESLVFCGLEYLKEEYSRCRREIDQLIEVLATYNGNPELINHLPETAPSKRIIQAVSKQYNYNKLKSGVDVTSHVGIEIMMAQCPHFKEWVEQLKALQQLKQ
jgi:hypothetical protein